MRYRNPLPLIGLHTRSPREAWLTTQAFLVILGQRVHELCLFHGASESWLCLFCGWDKSAPKGKG